MYRLVTPAPALRPYIESYWMLRMTADDALHETIFVDGKADILFTWGVPYLRTPDGQPTHTVTALNLDAQRTRPIVIARHGTGDLIGVRLRLGGLAAFVRPPLYTLTEQVIDAGDLLPGAAALEARLYDQRARPAHQAALLDDFFLRHLHVTEAHRLTLALAGRLATPDDHSVQEIGRAAGLSVRTVNRMFRHTFGFSAQMTALIARFDRARARMDTRPAVSLAQIALEAGYYDQAHFTHDFKRMTGCTPARYRALYGAAYGSPLPAADPPSGG